MSEFFELPEVTPRRRHRVPVENDGSMPPSLYLPGRIAKDLVLAKSEEHAVVLAAIACYPTGFGFDLETAGLFHHDHDFDEPRAALGHWVRRAGDKGLPPGLLRFGVEYSDGRKATTLNPARYGREPEDGGPALYVLSGGSAGDHESWRVWIAPLPPDGPVTFVCEWPAFGIEETRKSIPAARFRKAAERARRIF